MATMVEMVIDSVRVSLTNQQRVVLLRETDRDRYLPIWIGPFEAEAITIALQEIEIARPQTHDLLTNIIRKLDARLVRVEVVGLREDVFYGNLVLELDSRTVEIDSRPSDALALAARSHVPIFVASDVLDAAGIVPDQDLHSKPSSAAEGEAAPETHAAEDHPTHADQPANPRLSVFENFLGQINLDDLSSKKPSGSEDEPGEDEPDKKK